MEDNPSDLRAKIYDLENRLSQLEEELHQSRLAQEKQRAPRPDVQQKIETFVLIALFVVNAVFLALEHFYPYWWR